MFARTPGMVLAFYSVQNIDRLVSLFRAARRSGRLFVLDLYGAAVVAATGNPRIPQPDWPQVRVFAPRNQRLRVKRERDFERVSAVRASRIYPEELEREAHRLVMTFRHPMRADMERAGCLTGAGALWSMWPGYLAEASGRAAARWLEDQAIPLAIAHASGHATVADLRRLADAFAPARIVPVHTSAPEAFPASFPRVERHEDGETWAV
jgi:ribonuclease J